MKSVRPTGQAGECFFPPSGRASAPLCGDDCLKSLAPELDRLGCKRAMLVCGGSLSRNQAVMAVVSSAFGARLAGVFDGVQVHSPIPSVQAAARELMRLDADAIVALGGGSAIVSARAANILRAEGGRPAPALHASRGRWAHGEPQARCAQAAAIRAAHDAHHRRSEGGHRGVWTRRRRARRAMFDPKTRLRGPSSSIPRWSAPRRHPWC